MNRATPNIWEIAQRLIASGTSGNPSETKTSPAVLVCDKLGPHLATLMGNAGFRALLSRALAVSKAKVAWLHTVHVKADGSLQGFDEVAAQVDSEQIAKVSAILVSELLGLLAAFIGENLTVRLVRDVWPKLSLNDLNLGDGGDSGKGK